MTSILLVDRSRTAGVGLANSLRKRAGFSVINLAGDDSEATRLLSQEQPDVILLDIHHGDGDGTALCADIRRITTAPIVVLTSFMTAERWSGLKAAGASEFLLKHVDTAALERDLLRAAKSHSHPDGQKAEGSNRE